VTEEDYKDWGHKKKYKMETAVGECAGVIIDLVSTLFYEAEEKLGWAYESLDEGHFADAIYHAYNVFLQSAKAILLSFDITCNSQINIIKEFDKQFQDPTEFGLKTSFEKTVTSINKKDPGKDFAEEYIADSALFLKKVSEYRVQLTGDKIFEKNDKNH
jgi:sulfite reductase (ferredoxin)